MIKAYNDKCKERDYLDEELERKDQTVLDLEKEEKAMIAKYEKMMVDMKDRIIVLKLAQDSYKESLKEK